LVLKKSECFSYAAGARVGETVDESAEWRPVEAIAGGGDVCMKTLRPEWV